MTSKNVSLNNLNKALFKGLLDDVNINEVVINKFGEILIEKNGAWEIGTEEQCSSVTKDNLSRWANAVASNSNQKLNESNPILSTTLDNGCRVQIVIPPACDDAQFSVTIRKPSNNVLTLEDFKKQGMFDAVAFNEDFDETDFELKRKLDDKDFIGFFKLAVRSGKYNIAAAGATGSGKTTFMKALLLEIDEEERLLTIEDVRELFNDKHNNQVNLLYPANGSEILNPTTLLKSSLRMKPDRIILAELRGGEAFDYISVISSGHGGSLVSLHAGSYKETIRRLVTMTLQSETGGRIPYQSVVEMITDAIDIVVVIEAHKGKRAIKSIFWKDYNAVTECLNSK
ncbi:TPA: P-type DNA transfer ATPase VirB11 [Providencia rettgeri]|nr:P-type DNA transfer ATPase VirB11 [Providencia rettgeri]HEM7189730.1 P-type DNA transfer ATPase VirB11 [Providencia rettgeri]